jgi:hypothetical protein
VTADAVVAAGVAAARGLLEAGRTVVVVDSAEALVTLLDERTEDGPGRVAVLVGDPDDEAALDAARQLADQLFLPRP